MKDQRPYRLQVCLTDKEDRQLAKLASQQKMSKQAIVVCALEAYANED